MRSNSGFLPKRTHYAMTGGFQGTSRTNVRKVTLRVNSCGLPALHKKSRASGKSALPSDVRRFCAKP